MEFRILGPFEVRGESGLVPLGGLKPRAVLAVLLLHANEAVSAERLALALWGGDARDGAVRTVQVHISRLRKALSDPQALVTTPAGYRLRVRPDELDAERFARLVEDARVVLGEGRPEDTAVLLREALALWRGPPLAELAFEPFAQAEIERLEEQRLAALELRIEADLSCGLHMVLVGELQHLVDTYPTRERLVGQLMLALYRCGRQADALDAYQRTRARLDSELGIEPAPALAVLQTQILNQSPLLDSHSLSHVTTELPAAQRKAAPETAPPARMQFLLPRALRRPAGAPFLGREPELAYLRGRWDEVSSDAGAAVIVAGEAGIGKTRLACELAEAVRGQGALVLYGRCDEDLAVPYQPFVEALRPYAREIAPERLRHELGGLAPEIGRLLPELDTLGEPLRGDPETERFALFEAVVGLLAAATREQRVLLVLDDLHWATNPTLLLLRHIIRSERPLQIMLLGTYRDTELTPGQPLGRMLEDLHRDPHTEHLSIGGIDDVAIGGLLEAVGHAPAERRALVRVLQEQTAGNPFFLCELVAHMVEMGTIARAGEPGAADLKSAELAVPERLRLLIHNRVARLTGVAVQALNVAAVAGPSFSFELLERVLGEDPGLLPALEDAVARRLLTETDDGNYAFVHALVRQTTYDALGSVRRMRLHRRLGEALESFDDPETHVEALAHHFAQAAADGQGAKAAAYALAAGQGLAARLGYEEAAAYFERGLNAVPQGNDAQCCELLLALGSARWDTGEIDEARNACLRAADLAEGLGDASRLARAALGFGGRLIFELGAAETQPVLVDLLQRALVCLGDEDGSLRARVMARLAAALAYRGVEFRKPELARQALEMARRIDDKGTLTFVLAMTHWSMRGPDNLQECVATAAELARSAEEVGDRRLQITAHYWLIAHLLELGEIEAVRDQVAELQRLETPLDRYSGWLVTSAAAKNAHLSGRIEQFEALAHDALAKGFESREQSAAEIYGGHMFALRREQGRLDEHVEALEGFAARFPEVAFYRCTLAYVHVEVGRTERARRVFDALAGAEFADLPRDALWLPSILMLCEVAVALDDAARAKLLYDLLIAYADRCVVLFGVVCQGSASRSLGLVATTMRRFDRAILHFEDALEMNARIGSPLWVAHTKHGWASMLLRRGCPGDVDQALELVEETLATADELGLSALADRTRTLQQTALAQGSRWERAC
jgi:DNA-binding SARP family transcriptional activator/tetratricopeptide (TPR) repeat protein